MQSNEIGGSAVLAGTPHLAGTLHGMNIIA
jgi:hypothetical protein